MTDLRISRTGPGVYRVDHDDRTDTVYVAVSAGDQWAFWNGFTFRIDADAAKIGSRAQNRPRGKQSLEAPMPATVVKVLVVSGATVKKGDTVVLLEAMKMELPVRAPADAVVTRVNCREGDLVQAGATLVELE
jgi:biotin carboxyl carrier protein